MALVFTHGNFEDTALSLDTLDGNPLQALVFNVGYWVNNTRCCSFQESAQGFPNKPTGIGQVSEIYNQRGTVDTVLRGWRLYQGERTHRMRKLSLETMSELAWRIKVPYGRSALSTRTGKKERRTSFVVDHRLLRPETTIDGYHWIHHASKSEVEHYRQTCSW